MIVLQNVTGKEQLFVLFMIIFPITIFLKTKKRYFSKLHITIRLLAFGSTFHLICIGSQQPERWPSG